MTSPGSAGTPYRRWIVLGTVLVNLAMLYGAWYSYAVFLVTLLRKFHPALMWVAAPSRPHPAAFRNDR